MPPPRIAIASPNRNIWSETFIAAHLKRLKGVELVLTDGFLPNRLGDGTPILVSTPGFRWRNRFEQQVLRLNVPEMQRRRISTLLRSKKIQVLLAEYGQTGEEILASCQGAGVPLVVHFHGYDAHMAEQQEKYNNYERIFEGASALVVVSRSMEEELLRLGAPRAKVHYNCYGIDVLQFTAGSPRTAPPHFLSIGRFVEKKAPMLTLLAFHRLHEQRPDARLTMVGSGVLWEATRLMVKGLGLEGSVDLCGVKSPQEVSDLLHQSRAFVQHSVVPESGDSEGTPLAVLEAMASGIPVVATRHAGIADAVQHEQQGLLCEELDVDGMFTNMLRLCDDAELAGRMGADGRRRVEDMYRVEDSIAKLSAILEKVAAPAK